MNMTLTFWFLLVTFDFSFISRPHSLNCGPLPLFHMLSLSISKNHRIIITQNIIIFFLNHQPLTAALLSLAALFFILGYFSLSLLYFSLSHCLVFHHQSLYFSFLSLGLSFESLFFLTPCLARGNVLFRRERIASTTA